MLVFTTYGTPQPQGSSRAFMRPGWKHPVITTANAKNKPWRQELAQTATASMGDIGMEMVERPIPLRVEATFYFHKPKSVRKSEVHKTTKPDLDKLARSLLDALTGIVFEDDSQVSQCWINKFFGSPSRVEIRVTTMGEPTCSVPSATPKPALKTVENAAQ